MLVGIVRLRTKTTEFSMDLTLREEYWKKICTKLIAVISHDNYYRTTVTNKNLIQEEIKRRLNSGNTFTIQFRTFCPLVCCLEI
jgi:hypothetical protein